MIRQADNPCGPFIEIGFGIQIEDVWKFLKKEMIA